VRRSVRSVAAPVVTISAPFGTAGAIVGPAVAERLGVPFVDRAIPVSVALSMAVSIDEALAHDERAESFVSRLMTAFASSGIAWGAGSMPLPATEHTYREETERLIRVAAAQDDGCVILGRASAIVLRDHPHALLVRLEGSFEGRVRRVLEHSSGTEAEVRRFLTSSDKDRAAYFQRFYRADPNDARLFHLVIDSTVLSLETTIELIVTAARHRAQ
jgi:cytidylate kinase